MQVFVEAADAQHFSLRGAPLTDQTSALQSRCGSDGTQQLALKQPYTCWGLLAHGWGFR